MRHKEVLLAAASCLALAGAAPLRAQDTTKAPAPGLDSAQLYVGDWDFTVGRRDSTISGVWRINYTNGRFSGIAQRSGKPPAPISSITVRDHYRNITLTVYFDGESYTFSGHLDNPRTITGMLTTRGMARFRAVKL